MNGEPLILREKTGFEIVNPAIPVIINDFRNMEFYNNSDLSSRKTFNLPQGKYFPIQGHFRKLERPVIFPLNNLPLPERNKDFPFDFDVVFSPNPHKCTINWLTKTITFDNALKGYSLPELYFILFHEFAHSKYQTETLADALAENMMLQKGFNPSQISKAPITSLSHKQLERKINTVDRLFKRK